MGRAKHIDVVLGRFWHVDSIHLIFVLHAHSSDSSVCFSVHLRVQIVLCISGLPSIFATLHVSVSEISQLLGRYRERLVVLVHLIVPDCPDTRSGATPYRSRGRRRVSVPHSVKGRGWREE